MIHSAEGLTWLAAIRNRVKIEKDYFGSKKFERKCRQQITKIIIPAINATLNGMDNSGYARLSSGGYVNIVCSSNDDGRAGWLVSVDRLSAERYGPMLHGILSDYFARHGYTVTKLELPGCLAISL